MKHHRRPAGRIGRCSDRRRPYLQRRSGAGRMWASVTLLKQRRAFMTEIMSTTTVLVKSIKSTCRVKFATEKDHRRGAISILLVSRGSRGSWASGPPRIMGVWTSGCLDLWVSGPRGPLGVWIFVGVWTSLGVWIFVGVWTSWVSGPRVGVWTSGSSWVSGPLWTSNIAAPSRRRRQCRQLTVDPRECDNHSGHAGRTDVILTGG
jgi:hypothetical protein